MAIHKQATRAKAATAQPTTGVQQHFLGAGVLALTLAVVLARLAG